MNLLWFLRSQTDEFLDGIKKTITDYLLGHDISKELIKFNKKDNVLELVLPNDRGVFVVQAIIEKHKLVVYNSYLMKYNGDTFSREYTHDELSEAMDNFLRYFKNKDLMYLACFTEINNRLENIHLLLSSTHSPSEK